MKNIDEALEELARTVGSFDGEMAKYIREAKGSSPQLIADDLLLWGATGLVMEHVVDQEREVQRLFEANAIALAVVLRQSGAMNSRMEKWINAFELWANCGV